MKKIILIIALSLAAVTAASAQDYNWAIGLRGGGMASGLTVKHKVSEGRALEFTGNYWYAGRGAILTGLMEWNTPVITDGFNLYYGIGAHLGSGVYDNNGTATAKFIVGVDAVVGLEYKVPRAPIAFSLDYRPFLHILSTEASKMLGLYDIGLGVKFCF